jgi:hypothetical protein
MAKVHDLLEMWQGNHNLRATQKMSRTQNKPMTAVGYISDTNQIVKASWSLFQHDGLAAFKLSEKSPVPPALSGKDLPGGRTQILNVHRIRRVNRHSTESDEDSLSDSISDTKNWLNWNGDRDNPNESEDDWESDNEYDMKLDNGSKDSETPEQQNVRATPNVAGLIRPIRRTKKMVETLLIIVNSMETRRNYGIKKK